MTNIQGIKNGMVLQRNPDTNVCAITLTIDGASNPTVSLGTLKHLQNNCYCLTDIPVGGPYQLIIRDGSEEVSFDNLWVGDVWLLGGQSNMEGWAARREADAKYDRAPIPQIRAFYLDDHWDAAISQLHQQWTNADLGLAEKWLTQSGRTLADRDTLTLEDCGVGPGLFIGKYLYEHTGVPQGLIPCAFGGTCMDDWMPENITPTSQYQSMLRRFKACGSNVRGMFWYQGESDVEWVNNQRFTEKMIHFISFLRQDFSIPELPFVQAQIGQTQSFGHMLLDMIASWMRIRQQQAELHTRIPYFSTVSAANTYYHDLIHIDADSQEYIGKALAMEMLSLLGMEGVANPKLKNIEVLPMEGHLCKNKTAVVLTYDNVIGQLVSYGHPYGYSITLVDEIPYLFPYKGIDYIKLVGNQVYIVTEYTPEQLKYGYVWYGAGPNAVCTIQDEEGRAPLAMGPIKIT